MVHSELVFLGDGEDGDAVHLSRCWVSASGRVELSLQTAVPNVHSVCLGIKKELCVWWGDCHLWKSYSLPLVLPATNSDFVSPCSVFVCATAALRCMEPGGTGGGTATVMGAATCAVHSTGHPTQSGGLARERSCRQAQLL